MHAANLEIADLRAHLLRATWEHAEICARSVSGVWAPRAGHGAWGAFTQAEPPGDGTNPGAGPSK